MTNPLIEKYNELYGKKEEPKVIKADEFEGEVVTLEQVENAFKNWASNYTPVTSNLTSPSVATSTTNISITKPPTLKSYDPDDLKVSFLQIADKIKQGKANVGSMSIEHSSIFCSRITFEVYDYENP